MEGNHARKPARRKEANTPRLGNRTTNAGGARSLQNTLEKGESDSNFTRRKEGGAETIQVTYDIGKKGFREREGEDFPGL